MGRRPLGAALSFAILLAASCGSQAPSVDPFDQPVVAPLDPIPETALPGTSGRAIELDTALLAADAVDAASLELLLEDVGFVVGTERRFSETAAGRRRVTARVLVFETAQGAERYIDWLEGHVAELIGDAETVTGPGTPAGGALFVHEPSGCCHLETRLFLGAWRRDATVFTLKVGGQTVRRGLVLGFVAMLDAAV